MAPSAEIASGAQIWHHAQALDNDLLGEKVIVGKGAHKGPKVDVEKNSKVRDSVLIYEPTLIGR